MRYRQERLDNLILKELSRIIMRELYFDGALITLTQAETSSDLTGTVVKFSVFPSGKKEDALKILNKSCSFLRRLLMKKARMQYFPQISFKIDEGAEEAAKVEKIFLDDRMRE